MHASSILFIGQRTFSNTALTAAPHTLIKHKCVIYAGLKSMMVILGIPYRGVGRWVSRGFRKPPFKQLAIHDNKKLKKFLRATHLRMS